ncbi:hypothetical protein EF912_38515, partial [Streptomyces sp. WAC07061]
MGTPGAGDLRVLAHVRRPAPAVPPPRPCPGTARLPLGPRTPRPSRPAVHPPFLAHRGPADGPATPGGSACRGAARGDAGSRRSPG